MVAHCLSKTLIISSIQIPNINRSSLKTVMSVAPTARTTTTSKTTLAPPQRRSMSAFEARISLVFALASQASSVSQRLLMDLASETAKYVLPKRFESQNLEEALMAVPDLETVKFKVLSRTDKYEIREVEPYFIAETTMPDKTGFDFNGASQSFNVLAEYLFGKNTRKEKMEMTTPVITSRGSDGERMDMTTPVITKKVENEDKWKMSFVMPSKFGSDLPLPKDSSVKIREVPRKVVAVVAFSADPLSQAAAIEALRAYPVGLQVGGGINLDNCLSYIDEGASHVIVTSYVFNNGQMDLQRLKGLVNVVGKQRLVLDLSCRKKEDKYAIVTDRWQKFSDVYLDEEVLNFLAGYADEFLVHGVDVEGKKLGIDKELVALLGEHSPIPVTYAGGVTIMDDLETIKEAGKGRVDVTVGSALDIFGGNLAYSDVVAWHDSNRKGIN